MLQIFALWGSGLKPVQNTEKKFILWIAIPQNKVQQIEKKKKKKKKKNSK